MDLVSFKNNFSFLFFCFLFDHYITCIYIHGIMYRNIKLYIYYRYRIFNKNDICIQIYITITIIVKYFRK